VADDESDVADDELAGLCAVGYLSGRVQVVCVAGLRLLKERRVHVAAICAIEFGPAQTLLTAAVDGEVRLHSAAVDQLLMPLATLRPPNGVRVHCLDVLVGASPRTPSYWGACRAQA
jgi:hypothetical protein